LTADKWTELKALEQTFFGNKSELFFIIGVRTKFLATDQTEVQNFEQEGL
jgi:hypothetical protein